MGSQPDRYTGWHHGCEVDGPMRRCVNCLAEVNEGYYRVVDQRTEVCCDYCADLVLEERTLTELLLLEASIGILDELCTEVEFGDRDGMDCVPTKLMDRAQGLLKQWLENRKDKPSEQGEHGTQE